MSVHSKFLIHWTGWDFDPTCSCPGQNRAPEISDEDIRKEYVARLRNCCEMGLRMNPGKEEIRGRGNAGFWVRVPRLCFTEIRLSQVQCHTEKYGKLGIGFDRNFVIERKGNPVFYVQNTATSFIPDDFGQILGFLEKNNGKLRYDLLNILGFFKGMSTEKSPSDFAVYDEMEWRIVRLNELMKNPYNYIKQEKGKENVYRVALKPKDIKISAVSG